MGGTVSYPGIRDYSSYRGCEMDCQMALYKLCVINSTVLLDITISKFKVLTISNNTLLALRAGYRRSVFDRSVAVLRGRAPGKTGEI